MIALVAFLYLKEILPKSEKWNSDNNGSVAKISAKDIIK